MTEEKKTESEVKKDTQEIGVLNKFSLDLVVLSDSSKYYVDGLHITSEFTEVTNGHYAMRITNPKIDPDNYPVDPNGGTLYTKPIDIIVPAKVVERIRKNLPTKVNLPILEHAVPGGKTKDDMSSVEFVMCDLTVWSPIVFRPEDARYPNLDNVLPTEQPEAEIGFNPDYMIKLCQQFKKNDVRTVKLSLYGQNNAMKMEGKNLDTQQDIVALLMPMKI